MILIELEKALEVFGNIHPLDYNAQAYKSKIEKLKTYCLPEAMWEEVDWGKVCTNCKHEYDREIEYICRTDAGYILPKYCPMCGARIIGETRGEG